MTHRTHQERVGHTTAGNGFFFGTPTTNNTPNITPLTVPCILHISVSIILVLVVRRDVTACSLDFYSRKDPRQIEGSEGDSIVMGLLLSQVGKNGPSGCFPTTSVVVSHEIRPFPIVTTLLHITNSVPYPVSNNPILSHERHVTPQLIFVIGTQRTTGEVCAMPSPIVPVRWTYSSRSRDGWRETVHTPLRSTPRHAYTEQQQPQHSMGHTHTHSPTQGWPSRPYTTGTVCTLYHLYGSYSEIYCIVESSVVLFLRCFPFFFLCC